MRRKSFVPGAALVTVAALAAALAGCSGGSTGDGRDGGPKGGDTASPSPAQPGRYQSLPEPCGLPARGTVRAMLPGDDRQLSREEAEKIYAGQADVTYDTDRRVGCRWKRETTEGTRHLTLDIQRVVSYDNAVSDDDRAQEIYGKKEVAAGIPSGGSPSPTTSVPKGKDAGGGGTKSPGTDAGDEAPNGALDSGKDTAADAVTSPAPGQEAGTGDEAKPQDGGAASDHSAGSTEPSGTPGATAGPRILDGIADTAFLNDKLATADSGVHRDITVVFRTSNVIVTITYDQWSTDKSLVPGSQELQDKARSLAAELSDRIGE
ncbi:hypothetical protein [Streptomyces celluloflavus]|uniref:hypothetical protein n=1 Tax=Streptomyces celluloflavus TaxID=58344 RepID=UPI0036B70116